MHLMASEKRMETIVRPLDAGFGHTKFVFAVDGSEVRCAHLGIPLDGLIYQVGPDVNLGA